MNWQLYLLDDGYFGKADHGFSGVYRLIALASEGDATKPATLNRVGGQDATGTLYIGQASRLHSRLNQMRRTLRGREDTHGAIRRLKRIPALKIPSNKLGVALLFTRLRTNEELMIAQHTLALVADDGRRVVSNAMRDEMDSGGRTTIRRPTQLGASQR